MAFRIVPQQIPEKLHTEPKLSPFGKGTVSLRLEKHTRVYSEPKMESEPIALVRSGTRVSWKTVVGGEDCPTNWVEISPRGWVCTKLKPSPKAPSTKMVPNIRSSRKLVPGTYGRASNAVLYPDEHSALLQIDGRTPPGSLMVRRTGSAIINGQDFWKVQTGEYVARSSIRRFYASKYQGHWFPAPPKRALAFAISQRGYKKDVAVYALPSEQSSVVDKLAARTTVSVLETSPDDTFIRVGDHQWVRKQDLRIARFVAPPPQVQSGERWLDVDLTQQLAVAYEGQTPVFATLVSTGKGRNKTPTGSFRIQRKYATTTMSSSPGDSDPYSVADVPWSMFFHEGYALHASYWHNSFGYKKSHGCINLSPKDAKKMYEFLGPEVAPGWSAIYSHATQPGSLINIHY